MSQKIIRVIILILNRITHKSFLYINTARYNQLDGTAVQDENGIWHVGNVYNKNDITYGIAQNGHVEETESALFHFIFSYLKKQSSTITMYDIGANIGYYGIMAATKYEAMTHSFEPLPEYCNCIKGSITLNRTEGNHFVHQLALSDHQGEEKFTKAGSGSSLEKDFNELPELPVINVPVNTIDNLVATDDIALPHFIKVDVEGHELAVLNGGKNTVMESQPVFFIELCSSLHDIGRTYKNKHYTDTVSFFINQNYEMLFIKNNSTFEVWNENKTINYAGMFVCFHRIKHAVLIEEIKKYYTLVS